jgi:hypothetical protein
MDVGRHAVGDGSGWHRHDVRVGGVLRRGRLWGARARNSRSDVLDVDSSHGTRAVALAWTRSAPTPTRRLCGRAPGASHRSSDAKLCIGTRPGRWRPRAQRPGLRFARNPAASRLRRPSTCAPPLTVQLGQDAARETMGHGSSATSDAAIPARRARDTDPGRRGWQGRSRCATAGARVTGRRLARMMRTAMCWWSSGCAHTNAVGPGAHRRSSRTRASSSRLPGRASVARNAPAPRLRER